MAAKDRYPKIATSPTNHLPTITHPKGNKEIQET
jgi:hypothetical protein